MKSVRGFTVLAISAFLVSLGGAAKADSYNLHFGPSPLANNGFGQVQGTLGFQGPKSFSYDAYLYDICPSDSLGVSFLFQVFRTDGVAFMTDNKGRTTHVCGAGVNNYGGTVWSNAQKIQKTRVITCWAQEAEPCWAQDIYGVSNYKFNPYR